MDYRLTNTFKKLPYRNASKDYSKVNIPKLRSTTPSQLFEQGHFRKDSSIEKYKGSKTGRNNEKLKFSFVANKKFKLRNLSSISSSVVNRVPKTHISVKSRNRDSSAGSS